MNMNRNPTGKGGFKPGVSANPGGRPKVVAEVRALAQAHSAEVVKTLVEIMQNSKAPLAIRVAAANNILDRAVGRPEFSGKIETSQTKELDFSRLNEAERAIFEQLVAQARPFLERLLDDPERDGGTVN
jgi:hypothetical protein